MAYDFPASPSNGQIFVPPGGPTYQFTGYGWDMLGSYNPAFLQQQIITVSGAITLHAETTNFLVEVQGGGAGGAACNVTAAGQGAIGTGGGAGAYCAKWIKRPSGVYAPTCTIGANVGYTTNGNASTFSDGTVTLTAGGGVAGIVGAAAGLIAYPGSLGGVATGGDINARGEAGSNGFVTTGIMLQTGRGGGSRFGSGGREMVNTSGSAGTGVGEAGQGYGAGGSGAWSMNGGGNAVGGNGIGGLVVITEFR